MEVFGRYRLLRRFALGGMAEIFLARSASIDGFDKELVIKRIRPELGDDPTFSSMFINEAKISILLNHQNIIHVFDFGQSHGAYYLAMEHVDGCAIDELLVLPGIEAVGLAPPIALYVIQEVCRGLEYAHQRKDRLGNPLNIIHRDISPQNIMLTFDGGVKIADFGIAKAKTSVIHTEPGMVMGKLTYMSPEQATKAAIDARADVFSCGVVLWEMLVGRQVYGSAEGPDLFQRIRTAAIRPPSAAKRGLDPGIDAVVLRAVAKDPDDRYQTARELGADIHKLLTKLYPDFSSYDLQGYMEDKRSSLDVVGFADLEGEAAEAVGAVGAVSPRPIVVPVSAPTEGQFSSLLAEASNPTAEPPKATEPLDEMDDNPFAEPVGHLEHAKHLEHATHAKHLEHAKHVQSIPGPLERETTQTVPVLISEETTIPDAPNPFARVGEGTPANGTPQIRDDSEIGVTIGVGFGWTDDLLQTIDIFRESPSLWRFVDMGDFCAKQERFNAAMAFFRAAAVKFAQQGLFAQCMLCCRRMRQHRSWQDLIGEISRMPELVDRSSSEIREFLVKGDGPVEEVIVELLRSTELAQGQPAVGTPLLSNLDGHAFAQLVELAPLVHFDADTAVVEQGATDSAMYLIARGRVLVYATGHGGERTYLSSLSAGDFVGENSFFTSAPRSATVEALYPVDAIKIERPVFDQVMAGNSAATGILLKFYKERIVEAVLAKSPVFCLLPNEDRRAIVDKFDLQVFEPGQMVIREGELSDQIYLVKEGSAEVFTEQGGGRNRLSTLGPCTLFGEVAALRGIARTASVEATTKLEALCLPASDFHAILKSKPEVRMKVLDVVAERTRQNLDRLASILRPL